MFNAPDTTALQTLTDSDVNRLRFAIDSIRKFTDGNVQLSEVRELVAHAHATLAILEGTELQHTHSFRNFLSVIMSGTDVIDYYLQRNALGLAIERLEGLNDYLVSASTSLGIFIDNTEVVILLNNLPILETVQRCISMWMSEVAVKQHFLRYDFSGLRNQRAQVKLSYSELTEKLVLELLRNAYRYSPAGTEIKLSLSFDETADLVIAVRDYGIGINEEALPLIFQRGYRAEDAQKKTDGTGIGLFELLEIVSNAGGQIQVTSGCFCFIITKDVVETTILPSQQCLKAGTEFKVTIPSLPELEG